MANKDKTLYDLEIQKACRGIKVVEYFTLAQVLQTVEGNLENVEHIVPLVIDDPHCVDRTRGYERNTVLFILFPMLQDTNDRMNVIAGFLTDQGVELTFKHSEGKIRITNGK